MPTDRLNPGGLVRPKVFYDGGCSLCSREINHYRKLDRETSIQWVDISRQPQLLNQTGLTHDQAMQRLHALDEHGQWRIGTDAFLLIWSRLPGYRWLTRLVEPLGLHRLLEPAYNRFASWRIKRRGQQDSCAIR